MHDAFVILDMCAGMLLFLITNGGGSMSNAITSGLRRRAVEAIVFTKKRARTGVLLSVTLLAAPAEQCTPTGEPTEDSASSMGPYTFQSYTNGFDSPAFGPATIWYPANGQNNLSGIALAPGFLEDQGVFHGWGRFLASHGFVVITFSMNSGFDSPDQRATALGSAVTLLQAEGVRAGSPLNGRMSRGAEASYALMGHSMGGGGALVAARQNRSDIKAVIPLAPYYSPSSTNFGGVLKPTLIFAADNDTIAPANTHAYNFYVDVWQPPKVYAEFSDSGHFIANDPTFDDPNGRDLHRILARVGLSWLKIHLHNDTRYRKFITNNSQFRRYESARF